MVSKKTTSNDILVKVDHNNLMYIDPSSVLSNGIVEQRFVEPESLVMYVNLEADLVPRSILVSDNDKNSLTSIAKGTLNFLRKKTEKSKNPGFYDNDFDATWTDSFLENKEKKTSSNNPTGIFTRNDDTGQTFGIESIDIKILGMNFIPQVNINFIDVRGKTLFENPELSPYNAFFHLPWPIFYLTVKGYYGKAIKYRLHLTSFKSRFNPANGNFEISTTFVGSTYAYLTDIPLDGILFSPYMYKVYSTDPDKGENFNEKTGYREVTLKKSTRGYVALTSVYNEYKKKGYLPPDFPVKTLREIAILAKRLDKILESMIFSEVIDPIFIAGIKEFSDTVYQFRSSLLAWRNRYLDRANVTEEPNPADKDHPTILYQQIQNKTSYEKLTGTTTGSLQLVIDNAIKKLDENPAFGSKRNPELLKKSNINRDVLKDLKSISFDSISNVANFCVTRDSNTKLYIKFDSLISELDLCIKQFEDQRERIAKIIEAKMNEVTRRDDIGLGFTPTIRNVFGVLLANAETYIRLLKDVHFKAFDKGQERKTKVKGLYNESTDDNVYPWPEIKKKSTTVKENVLVYPGSTEMEPKLNSHDPDLWPEVDFVENFYAVSTYTLDPLTDQEGNRDDIEYIFSKGDGKNENNDISTFTYLVNYSPYYDKSMSNVLYEIWERARYATSVDSFNSESLKELALIEFKNIQDNLSEDYDILEFLKKKITSPENLHKYMEGLSPFERYPYYKDQLPTVSYVKDLMSNDFKIEKFVENTDKTINTSYPKLQENLNRYESENYRANIYPFNSDLYLQYLGQSNFTTSDLRVQGMMTIESKNYFIGSPIDPNMWVRNGFTQNMLSNNVQIGDFKRHILNTPYFHKQLFKDYTNDRTFGKYAGSAYLLLNSLPFKDLDEKIEYNGKSVLMSSLFREISASHFIPYHLMLKWGSIYHRYKNYILNGEDILIPDITQNINQDLFYDNFLDREYDLIDNLTVKRTDLNNIGIYPFYQSTFHQIVNDYTFFDPTSVDAVTDYYNGISNGVINVCHEANYAREAWSTFIDNSKFQNGEVKYTILPSNGSKVNDLNDYFSSVEDNYRIIWSDTNDEKYPPNYNQEKFPLTDQYFKTINNEYSLTDNNKKILDLIATFKSDILDMFEDAFLEFASAKLNVEISNNTYDIPYNNFQTLLKEIVSVYKDSSDSVSVQTMNQDVASLVSKIKQRQLDSLKAITTTMLNRENLIKLTMANPKEIDMNTLGGFTNVNVENFYAGEYHEPQLADNLDYIKLYLGEDIDNYYQEFFAVNNIEVSEENIKRFRPLIYMYGGYAKSIGSTPTNESFVSYLKNNIIIKQIENPSDVKGQEQRFYEYIRVLVGEFPKLEPVADGTTNNGWDMGYEDAPIKLELYNLFKSFNDKWTSGNSIGQRTLMEEFLFLDRANRDIGDEVYLDLKKISSILSQKNVHKLSLYNVINLLIKDSGFDIRALPAYVNFYGTNYSNKTKIVPSKNVAKNLFGTFLELDYQESSPKIILMYLGPTSKHPDIMDINKKYRFRNDSFDISNPNNNPVVVANDIFLDTDFSKSNKVVAFEVGFGDQSQSMFKSLTLDQNSLKNTTESFEVLERLGKAETGSGVSQIDIGLFDIYRQVSYTCDVVSMGNVMIQPTMYFYLKNVPMFTGSYWITEVGHSIKTTGIETTFKGTRIPLQSLPDPKDSFMAAYRSLFDTITKSAIRKVNEDSFTGKSSTERTIYTNDGMYNIDMGNIKEIQGEKLKDKDAGIKEYQIPYNGYMGEKYVQLVEYDGIYSSKNGTNGNEWLRAQVIEMGSPLYTPSDNTCMSLVPYDTDNKNRITWGDLKDNKTGQFYSARFTSKIRSVENLSKFPRTEFLNPSKGSKVIVTTNVNIANKNFDGPINVGPAINGYGIGLSYKLCRDLDIQNGDVVYFRLVK